jgi:UDP-N-acetylmuramate dehydrogenase
VSPVASLPGQLQRLADRFGDRLQFDVPLARYTSARIGGPAEVLLAVLTAEELAAAAGMLWETQVPFRVLGGGSNVLISDRGVPGMLLLNQAKTVRFEESAGQPQVWAESGASFGTLGRRASEKGLAGLEWAVGVPGTVGGAVVGNAGAHQGDIAGALKVAEILQPGGQVEGWTPERLQFGYRESWLKRHPRRSVVLSATFMLQVSNREATQSRMMEYTEARQRTQPPGASWGSMFKNPSGDFAGRLIEAAGLKGAQVGQAQVSPQHANFFVNLGGATAVDAWELIRQVREKVKQHSGIDLELEIERIGDWEAGPA